MANEKLKMLALIIAMIAILLITVAISYFIDARVVGANSKYEGI